MNIHEVLSIYSVVSFNVTYISERVRMYETGHALKSLTRGGDNQTTWFLLFVRIMFSR